MVAMDRDTEDRKVPYSRNGMARSKKLSGFIPDVKVLLVTSDGTACFCPHTLSLGRRKTVAEFATDRLVESQVCPSIGSSSDSD